MIGTRLGHYRILGRLGAGGMGEVYRARDEKLDRDVAVKVLPEDALGDAGARARLVREAKSAAALNHPNVCTIHEVGEADGRVFIAMELVEGQPLDARIRSGGLPADQVIDYGLQVADAVAHAHERGIVHRDLKPSNMLVTAKDRVKVLDFGLAKPVETGDAREAATASQATLTQAGSLVGTLPYMSPEQLRGEAADARSDVWSLGVVLHEMASGKKPFPGQTGFEVSSAILTKPPAQLPAGVPRELAAVVARCLEKEPARRYQRGGEVEAALGAVKTGSLVLPRASRGGTARRWLAWGAAAATVAALVLALRSERLRERLAGTSASPIHTLAVLPLENLSGDPGQEYFADGMTDALITDLARLKGLKRVIARSSVMRLKKTERKLSDVARDLGVDTLVTGAVVRSGNRVRVTAQLVRPETEEQLWAQSYEREVRDVLSLQNEIVEAITRQIRVQLTPEERTQLSRARPVDPQAYEAYLRGMYHLNKLTPEGFEKGLAELQKAVDGDPSDPYAWAGLALGYSLVGHDRFPDSFERARAAAKRAEELGGTLAKTRLALAEIRLYSDWDVAGALPEFRSAVELDPSLAEAHRHTSWCLNASGQREEGFAEMRRAQQVDPLSPVFRADLGWQYWLARDDDAALREARKALELNPDFAVAWAVVGYAYAAKGMFDEAIEAHRKAAAADADWRWPLGRTYALAGRRDEAEKLAEELKKEPTPLNAFGLAGVYAALGDKDEAFAWMARAAELRFSWMPWIRMDHSFAPLRGDPRFAEFCRRWKLPA